jgi:hypothetical protein
VSQRNPDATTERSRTMLNFETLTKNAMRRMKEQNGHWAIANLPQPF